MPLPRSQLILLLAATAAISPLAIDLYLPAIPLIAEDFAISADRIAVTISLYMLGLAGGQLVGGVLSDRLGRRPVMLTGMLLFALCSALIAVSDSWQMLWAVRVLQAIGGGMIQVGIPAIIRDQSEGAESARMLASIALIMIAAPAVAPSLGSLILFAGHWRWIFILLTVYALFMALTVYVKLPEPSARKAKPAHAATQQKTHWLRQYQQVLLNRSAIGFMVAQACSFSVMLIFVTNSSYVYQEHFSLSNGMFSMLFAGNIAVMAIMNRVNVRWLRKHEPELLAWRGVSMQACAVFGLLLATLFTDSLWLTVPFVLLSVGAQGAIGANTNASALRHFKHNSGVASATLGILQFTLGAAISAFSTRFQTGEIWPMALVMMCCVTLGLYALAFSRKRLQPSNGLNIVEQEA